jgi:hypothetical protein
MDETQTLAVLALRELLDNPERDDWDDLLAANRVLIKAIATGEPMTRRNARIVAEYLREAGWRERAIGAATGANRCLRGHWLAEAASFALNFASIRSVNRSPPCSRQEQS